MGGRGAGAAAASPGGDAAGAAAAVGGRDVVDTAADGTGAPTGRRGRRRAPCGPARTARRLRCAGVTDVPLHPAGPPETVLPPDPADAVAALGAALDAPAARRREEVASVVARWPGFLDGWARLGELARDDVEAYACFRVGYHRGLDRLRRAGWRGSGYVRWQHPSNRGFLRSLAGLGRTAGALGEADEEARCAEFLRQLDPDAGGAGAGD